MAHFNFELEDMYDDATWSRSLMRNAGNTSIKTSGSSDAPTSTLTTLSVSDIMQGAALYRPIEQLYEESNQAISSQTSALIRGQGGVEKVMPGGRSGMLAYDIMTAEAFGVQNIRPGGGGGEADAGAAAGGPLHPASNASGTYTPEELKQYGNGRIPASALAQIGGGHMLWAPAATAYQQMKAQWERDGARISITDSYRDYAAQVDVKRRKGNLAATPGTSNHGWGVAIDFNLQPNDWNSQGYKWMVANANKYGWVHPDWAQRNGSKPEVWHWEYRGGR